MDMMQYQYIWHKAGSNVFNLEIFMSKIYLALVDQYGKIDKIMEKKQDRHISSHDISKN